MLSVSALRARTLIPLLNYRCSLSCRLSKAPLKPLSPTNSTCYKSPAVVSKYSCWTNNSEAHIKVKMGSGMLFVREITKGILPSFTRTSLSACKLQYREMGLNENAQCVTFNPPKVFPKATPVCEM